MYNQGEVLNTKTTTNLGIPPAPALKLLFQKKSVLINSYIFMEKLSPQKFLFIPIFPY